jgi:predicted unusual protein kinase regulating ubiquinone biosynthesis (AarF/ABC1/UbiB family)
MFFHHLYGAALKMACSSVFLELFVVMEEENLITGTLSRLFKIGETAGRMGLSLMQRRILEALNRPMASKAGLDQVIRAVETLSKLKGAPMKIGQMLSLHEDLLPPEIISIFKILQNEARPAPFSQMKRVLEEDLGGRLQGIRSIEERPFAAASIGQVHRAVTEDGRDLVLKIQYPDIRAAIDSDLKSLRVIFSSLFQVLDLPFDIVWPELVSRLHEELDYQEEMHHLIRYREQLEIDGLIVPEPIPEFSSLRVLAMRYEEAMSLDRALSFASSLVPEEEAGLRDGWSMSILRLVFEGLFRLRLLHADPNAANFGFRANGDVVLYDLGCMKVVPDNISKAYASAARCIFMHDERSIPGLLMEAGIHRTNGDPVSMDFLEPHIRLIQEIFPDTETAFGSDPFVYARIVELSRESWEESHNIVFPADILFIHRTLAGHFGNLRRLAARRNWRRSFLELLEALSLS